MVGRRNPKQPTTYIGWDLQNPRQKMGIKRPHQPTGELEPSTSRPQLSSFQVWQYRDADPHFGSWQAKELSSHLKAGPTLESGGATTKNRRFFGGCQTKMIKMPEFLVDIDLCKMILKLEVLERNAQK